MSAKSMYIRHNQLMSLTHPPFPESTIKEAQEEFTTSLKECVENVWLDFYANWDDSMEFNKKVKKDMNKLEDVINHMESKIVGWTSQFENTHFKKSCITFMAHILLMIKIRATDV